jgi:CRISPR-associated exonuclease Cas4
MYPEDSLLPISALQHLLFCERQCALIHLERLWVENRLTVEGRHLHRKAHDASSHWQGDIFIARGLRLRSLRLGLFGQADVVEFHPPSASDAAALQAASSPAPPKRDGAPAVPLPRGWRAMPIEYKRGRPKANDCDRVQLCAQAMCLEEMLESRLASGALFYGQRRRRTEVNFDNALRGATERAVARLHELIEVGITPGATREKKCDSCSLLPLCMPRALGSRAASVVVASQFAGCEKSVGPLTDVLV